MQGVSDPHRAGGSDVQPTGTQIPPMTLLGSKSSADTQVLRIFFISEGARLGCAAAIPVTFTGISVN